MYEWIPQKTNQKARNAVFLLLGGAAALMVFPILFSDLPFRWVVQLLAFVLLTVAIFLVARYTAKAYVYRVLPREDGSRDLTVTELKAGKTRMIVCRIGLGGIQTRLLADTAHAAEAEALLTKGKKARQPFFDYCVDLKPAQSILLVAEEGGERMTIRLSYDPTLFDLLTPTATEEQDEDEP